MSEALVLKSAKFLTSIADIAVYESFAEDSVLPEICIAGRSNVGKSSLINMLAGQKKLAKTSATPGRTRLLNLFEFEGRGFAPPQAQQNPSLVPGEPCVGGDNQASFILVDLPGYGFAQAAKSEIARWGNLIDQYFASTQKLIHVFSLVDIRHAPSALDRQMVRFLFQYRVPFTLVATKADKLSKSVVQKHVQMLANELMVGRDDIIPCSAENGDGKARIFARLGSILLPMRGRDNLL